MTQIEEAFRAGYAANTGCRPDCKPASAAWDMYRARTTHNDIVDDTAALLRAWLREEPLTDAGIEEAKTLLDRIERGQQ